MKLGFGKDHERSGGFPGNQGPPGDTTISKIIGDWSASGSGVEAVVPLQRTKEGELGIDRLITKVVICRYQIVGGEIFENIDDARQRLIRHQLADALRKYPHIDSRADQVVEDLIKVDLDDLVRVVREVNAQVDMVARSR